MLDDDDVLNAYEDELARTPSNRGFWLVVVSTATACAVLLVAIFANRPLVSTIAQSESELRHALEQAEGQFATAGTFESADAQGLTSIDRSLEYLPAQVPSGGPGYVSVYASSAVWAASVQARTGTCFYVRQEAGRDPAYGLGTVCTGEAALAADQPSW